jgi:toxin ParE1/3/4
MPGCRLSIEADRDIAGIADYTLATFGERQVIKYLASLERTFQLLADFPGVGLPVDDLPIGCFRLVHQRHVIFYERATDHILIVRVLHASADFPPCCEEI